MDKILDLKRLLIIFLFNLLYFISTAQESMIFKLSEDSVVELKRGDKGAYCIYSVSSNPDEFLGLKDFFEKDSTLLVTDLDFAYLRGYRVLIKFCVSKNYTGGVEQAVVARKPLTFEESLKTIFGYKKIINQ